MGNRGRERKVQPLEALLRRAMPPGYDAREKLEKAASAWESVAGPVLGRQSVPLDIVNGELLVVVENPLVGNRVAMMGGNIARTMAERWGLEVVKVKVVVGRLPLKSAPRRDACPKCPVAVHVREEDVKEFSLRCLESLPDFPEDAAESLARLRAFFIKRFKR
ncbi:MAG: DUF721 domain-containing protein [Synergistaceae bacterium]|nr:DUF721 domain-containing protein [Synergistaceae bacterium]